MSRNRNRNNGPFSSNEVSLVWRKATVVAGYDQNQYRKDVCGHWIQYGAYGNTNSEYGWEIDHIKPLAKGGSDDLSNLQPLYWETNRDKADTYPWNCQMR
jgi:5-methylcytosine-specific restriction endonuclease McrA